MAATDTAADAAPELHRAPIDPLAFAKEGGIVAALVFALAFAIVGFKIEDVPGGLELLFRIGDVFWAAGLAFVLRALFMLTRDGWPEYAFYGGLALSSGMLLVLLSGVVFPFEGAVVNWILWILFAVLTIRAYVVLDRRGHVLTAEERESAMDRLSARVQWASRYLGPGLAGLGLLAPLWVPELGGALGLSGLNIGLAVLVMTYIMLGWGLNIVVGLAGLLDLGYVAFYAVGAYSYALLAEHAGMSFWACLPIAGVTAAFAGVLLGFPVLRLRGDYLAIVTLGFGEMIRLILVNWFSLTNGPDGIRDIPSATLPVPDIAWGTLGGMELPYPTVVPLTFDRFVPEGTLQFHEYFGLAFNSEYKFIFLYYVIFAMALAVNFFTLRIRKLPVGRAWEALREDEIACRSLGINPTNTKLTAFGIGAMFGGFAGAFFATRQGSITPESFVFLESAVILAIVVLGGMGSQVGVVIAAVALIGLPEIFRELEEFRLLAFGGSMVLIMIWRPKGLLAHRDPTVRLADGDPPPGKAAP